jgi:trehalose 6-phosphate phosphatase
MLSLKARALLAQKSLGMIFDIGGTLSPIAPTPNEAWLHPGVVTLLEQLRERAYLAILTGREIENGAKMIHLEGLTYVGTHGLEWSEGLPQAHGITLAPDIAEYIEPARALLRLAETHLAQEPGILIEYKRIGGAVHYRLAPNAEIANPMGWWIAHIRWEG